MRPGQLVSYTLRTQDFQLAIRVQLPPNAVLCQHLLHIPARLAGITIDKGAGSKHKNQQ
jgi:hypothetical protein